MKREKNKLLEDHKNRIAIKAGYRNWVDLRSNVRLQDAFIYLHDACESAISEVQKKCDNQITHLKVERKQKRSNSLQSELKKYFPTINQ